MSLAVLHRWMGESARGFEEMRRITGDDLGLMARRLGELYRSGRERSLPLDCNRIRLLPAGIVLMGALFRSFGIERVRITARDLRWGSVLGGGTAE